jgi:hypothetical protein
MTETNAAAEMMPDAAGPPDATPAAQPVAPPAAGWWRRNRWGLLALLLLLPLGLAAIFADSWLSYFDSRPSRAVVADAEEQVQLPTAAFETIASARLPADTPGAVDMPAGTELVLARLAVTPASTGVMCEITLAAADGVGEWRPIGAGEYGWSPEEGLANGYCDSARAEPYSVDLAFLVPESADAELELVVENVEWFPEYLRIRLPPPLE